MRAILFGVPGFFAPRMPPTWMAPKGTLDATSFCDTSPLKTTLESLVDFDRINEGEMRFNIGAVNVTTGDFVNFDRDDTRITPEHVMASGALPPGLPPVQIGQDYFWDGGLIFNTPLQWVLEKKLAADTLVFQVDLWSADGEFPQNIADVLIRQKDIQYSSRTRANTDRFLEQHKLRHAIAQLLPELPEKFRDLAEVKLIAEHADSHVCNIVHLIYHNASYEGYAKDTEFSRLSMEEHWESGYRDTLRALKHPQVLQRPRNKQGVGIFDFSRERKLSKKPVAA